MFVRITLVVLSLLSQELFLAPKNNCDSYIARQRLHIITKRDVIYREFCEKFWSIESEIIANRLSIE